MDSTSPGIHADAELAVDLAAHVLPVGDGLQHGAIHGLELSVRDADPEVVPGASRTCQNGVGVEMASPRIRLSLELFNGRRLHEAQPGLKPLFYQILQAFHRALGAGIARFVS